MWLPTLLFFFSLSGYFFQLVSCLNDNWSLLFVLTHHPEGDCSTLLWWKQHTYGPVYDAMSGSIKSVKDGWMEWFAGTDNTHRWILTQPWRWQSQVGSTCHRGNNWGQKSPGPPSWWPSPQRRMQRCSRPTPGGKWCGKNLINKKKRETCTMITKAEKVLINMDAHFAAELQRCQERCLRRDSFLH